MIAKHDGRLVMLMIRGTDDAGKKRWVSPTRVIDIWEIENDEDFRLRYEGPNGVERVITVAYKDMVGYIIDKWPGTP